MHELVYQKSRFFYNQEGYKRVEIDFSHDDSPFSYVAFCICEKLNKNTLYILRSDASKLS
jgi:hypothetical protein